jgi:hypothetical protein
VTGLKNKIKMVDKLVRRLLGMADVANQLNAMDFMIALLQIKL